MLQARPEGYIGKQFVEGFTGYFSADDFYGVVALEKGITQDEGKQLLEQFKQGLLEAHITNLSTFESTVSDLILKLNFPVHVGLAVGMTYKDALYVKTVGDGQIYFRRGNNFDLLMSGDKCASGYLQQFDMAIFTTTKIQEVIGNTEDFQAFVGMSKPSEIIEQMHGEEYAEEERGFGVLFVEYSEKNAVVQPETDTAAGTNIVPPSIQVGSADPVSPPAASPNPVPDAAAAVDEVGGNTTGIFQSVLRFIRSKGFAIIAVVLLVAVLAWSVIFGYQRRQAAQTQQRIETTQQEIEVKLTEAEEGAFLNLEGSLILVEEAKNALAQLKSEVGDSYPDRIAAIESSISETESKIVKKEEKEFDEFYDLTLESEDAKGDTLAIEENSIAVLDSSNEKVYLLDLEQKSLTEYTDDELSSASLVSIYNGDVFFFHPQEGIFKFTTQSNTNNVIEFDGDWGDIVDMSIYNGNIYLLDSENDEVYKYLVTEGGYSDKTSYFNSGQSIDLGDATGMVIDSAIYISTQSEMYKYLSGGQEDFSTSFPNDSPQFDDVYTNPDIENVFALDKAQATVYILSKEGEYGRQVQSSVFAKAEGIYVFEDEIHVLVGEKLYAVSLE